MHRDSTGRKISNRISQTLRQKHRTVSNGVVPSKAVLPLPLPCPAGAPDSSGQPAAESHFTPFPHLMGTRQSDMGQQADIRMLDPCRDQEMRSEGLRVLLGGLEKRTSPLRWGIESRTEHLCRQHAPTCSMPVALAGKATFPHLRSSNKHARTVPRCIDWRAKTRRCACCWQALKELLAKMKAGGFMLTLQPSPAWCFGKTKLNLHTSNCVGWSN